MPWYAWIIVGLLCVGFELVVPGVVLIFFGLAALVVGVFAGLGLGNIVAQVAIFVVLSVAFLVFLRKWFIRAFGCSEARDSSSHDGQDFAQVVEPILGKKAGRIRYAGTTWNAYSVTEGNITQGEMVRILRREGNAYFVEPVSSE